PPLKVPSCSFFFPPLHFHRSIPSKTLILYKTLNPSPPTITFLFSVAASRSLLI
ncbi:Uncharacterized protein TCM_023903, partial [Theobroma cacao]